MGALLDLATRAEPASANAQLDATEALPAVSGDQPGGDKRLAELRRLVEAIARANPMYWTSRDIEEAVAVGSADLDSALTTFRAIAAGYGVAPAGRPES